MSRSPIRSKCRVLAVPTRHPAVMAVAATSRSCAPAGVRQSDVYALFSMLIRCSVGPAALHDLVAAHPQGTQIAESGLCGNGPEMGVRARVLTNIASPGAKQAAALITVALIRGRPRRPR